MNLQNKFLLICILLLGIISNSNIAQQANDFAKFDTEMSFLHKELKIPGMSVAVVAGDSIIFTKAYGYADIRQLKPAQPETAYEVASLSQPLAAFLLQLYQQKGILSLSDNASDYGISFRNSAEIRVYHLMSHTSESKPGTRFHYNEHRFGALDSVFRHTSGLNYADLLRRDIITPLGLDHTAPSELDSGMPVAVDDPNYSRVTGKLSKVYSFDSKGIEREASYPAGYGPAAGLISSVVDYCRFLIAQDSILPDAAEYNMYSSVKVRSGKLIPYGLGWFVQDFNGHHYAWHHGWNSPVVSDFVIQDLTSGLKMVVLANSDMLSRPFQLEHGNFLQSPVAQIFLRSLCFPGDESLDITDYEAETWNKIRIATGENRAVSILAKLGLALIFLILISALILWPLAWLLRKPWKNKTRKLFRAIRYGGFFTFSRYFTSALVIIYLLVSNMLGRHSELIYWTDFPGIIAGASLYQNIVIALPSVLAVLYPLQVIWLIRVWTGRFGTFNWRVQYSLISLAILGYIAFLINWNLVGLSYYFNWL